MFIPASECITLPQSKEQQMYSNEQQLVGYKLNVQSVVNRFFQAPVPHNNFLYPRKNLAGSQLTSDNWYLDLWNIKKKWQKDNTINNNNYYLNPCRRSNEHTR